MRCSSCGKFVSYDDPPTVGVQSTSVDAEPAVPVEVDVAVQPTLPGVVDQSEAAAAPATEKRQTMKAQGTVTVSARVVLCCADCNDELKESTIESEADFEHTCDPDGKPEEGYDPATDAQFEADDPDGDGNSRTETKDRNGKAIKNPRYWRTYYGFDAEVDVKCRRCGQTVQVNVSGEEQASAFEELQ